MQIEIPLHHWESCLCDVIFLHINCPMDNAADLMELLSA